MVVVAVGMLVVAVVLNFHHTCQGRVVVVVVVVVVVGVVVGVVHSHQIS